MKKIRIVSLLLSAALVFTSLPIMATGVAAEESAEPAAMEKLDSIEIPTNSANGWSGAEFVSDDYRAIALRGSAGCTPIVIYDPADTNSLCDDNVSYKVYYTFRKNDARITNDPIVSSYDNARKLEFLVIGLNSNGGVNYGLKAYASGGIALTNEWLTKSGTFKIPANSTSKYGLYFMPQGNDSGFVEWDIQGIKVVEAANENNVVFTFGAFSDPAAPNWELLPAASTWAVKRNDLMKNSWLSIDLAGTGASYDVEDTKLLPGVYQLTGTFNTNADEVSLCAKVGNEIMNVGATAGTIATVDATAKEHTFTLTLTEEALLSDISFVWSKDSSSAATEIVVKNVKFKCVDLVSESLNSSIKRGTLVAGGETAAFWTTDTGSVTVDNSRNYVQCHVRGGGLGFKQIVIYDPNDADASVCELDVNYRFTIQIRQNENCENKDKKMHVSVSEKGYGDPSTTMTVNYGKDHVIPDNFTEITGTFTLPSTGSRAVTAKRIFKMFPQGSDKVYVDWDIRGIKIERVDNGKVVLARGVYDEKLSPSEWNFPPQMKNDKQTHFTSFTELMLTPSASGSAFAYDATNKDITLVPGKYVVTSIVNATEGTQNVKLSAKAENGEMGEGDTYTIGTEKTTVQMEFEVTENTLLSEIAIELEGAGAVYFTEFRIMKKGIEFNLPNVGIIMALLVKRGGPNRHFKRTNFFERYIEDMGTEAWTYPEGRTFTVETVDGGKAVLSMSALQKNMDTFKYSFNYELKPGKYELSGAIRTTNAKDTSTNRFKIGNTEVGKVSFTHEWTHFTFTFNVTDFTPFSFSVFGGTWEGFKLPYQLTNLSLVDLNETEENRHVLPWHEPVVNPDEPDEPIVPDEPIEVEESDAEVVIKAVEGSLAPNVYLDVNTDKWDIKAEKYGQQLSVKSKDGNLYLAMRNVAHFTDNRSGFTYSTGITLEPGTYAIECDARTAFKGEIAMARVFVNGAIVKSEWINNEWTALDGIFVVTEPTELVIYFAGGADVNYIKDFDVANINIVKK